MQFYKYQGAGNDFIILDGRNGIPENLDVAALCDRRFGIGADGLMYLVMKEGYDFEMVYYNSDGRLSSMCGNGGRCLAHFAHRLGLGSNGNLQFIAVDGPHSAVVKDNMVSLGMKDVPGWEKRSDQVWTINTGSPHYVAFINEKVSDMDLISFAKSIRYNEEFSQHGINVNIVQKISDDTIEMRTYERGVEDETLSCGTGVTAAALVFQIMENRSIPEVQVKTKGGDLRVFSEMQNGAFTKVILHGPAVQVFRGEI